MKKIKVLLIILITVFIHTNVYASTNTYNRDELENHGVKKNWKITTSNIDNINRTPAVDSTEKIYDYADLLTDEEERLLKEKIDEFIEKYKMDFVIVTNNYEYPASISNYCYSETQADKKEDEANEEYASDFYDYNDFGMIFENNSGILLFRNTAIDPCFHEMYYDMYTFGNAQLYFNQYRYDSVLDGIYNNLRSKNYYNGFVDYISRVSNFLDEGIPSDLKGYTVDENGYLQPPPRVYHPPIIGGIGIGVIISGIVIIIMIAKNNMVKKATKAEEYLNKGKYKLTTKSDVFLRSHTTHYTVSSSSSGGGHSSGGHSSHSGSSGGGHSSGGGRHG